MLYSLLGFALRPFRRWWRRAMIAAVIAVIAVVVVPGVRQFFDESLGGSRETITVPQPTP